MMKEYTVKELSIIGNVSIRTLHHYDEIDLLKPAFVGDNGYRYYQSAQLTQLMQILFYKELDFSLEEIKQILADPNFDKVEAFQKHKHLLRLQIKRTKRLINTIDQILDSMKGNQKVNTKKTSQAFDSSEIDQYKNEVKARWGHTEAYRQSMQRYKSWSKADLEKIKQEGHDVTLAISQVMDLSVDNAKVQALIKKHHQHINRFYDCSIEIYRGLGEMYFADPRFTKTYEDIKPGLAKFINLSIAYYCHHQTH